MGKLVDNTVLDAALNVLKSTATTMTVCSTQPVVFADVATYALADVAVATGDWTIADGDSGDGNGRKVTVAAKNGVLVDTSGSAQHVAITTASALLYVTTCTTQALTSGNNVNIPAWKVQIADPT
jgi:hypothetical protein